MQMQSQAFIGLRNVRITHKRKNATYFHHFFFHRSMEEHCLGRVPQQQQQLMKRLFCYDSYTHTHTQSMCVCVCVWSFLLSFLTCFFKRDFLYNLFASFSKDIKDFVVDFLLQTIIFVFDFHIFSLINIFSFTQSQFTLQGYGFSNMTFYVICLHFQS